MTTLAKFVFRSISSKEDRLILDHWIVSILNPLRGGGGGGGGGGVGCVFVIVPTVLNSFAIGDVAMKFLLKNMIIRRKILPLFARGRGETRGGQQHL